MLVEGGKPRYQGPSIDRGGVHFHLMPLFRAFALCIAFALAGVVPVSAFEVISVPEDVNAVNLTGVVDVVAGQDGKVQLSTAAGDDGIIRRIEVLASTNGGNPNWALFALRNDGDAQLERLLVAVVLPPARFWNFPSRSGRSAHHHADPERGHPSDPSPRPRG